MAVPAGAAPVVTLTGGGNGHGIGMSQWGAEGLARQGRSGAAIIAHYYPQTTLGVLPATGDGIRVLLDEGARITLVLPARTRVGGGARGTTASGAVTATIAPDGTSTRLVDANGHVVATGAALRLTSSTATLLAVAGARYRGSLVLRRRLGAVALVNELPVDQYLRGVIAREVYSSWRAATLAAQAIVARSYAIASRRASDVFDVYPDERSQVYGGASAETAPTDLAVSRTARRVVLYRGAVAQTFFYDTSPGFTASVQDVWTGSDPLPYLQSVPDPTSVLSPRFRWTPVRLTASALGSAFGLGPATRVAFVRGAGGWVRTVTVTAGGRSATLSGAQARSALGLRSSWFRLRLLDLGTATRDRTGGLTLTGRSSPGGSLALRVRAAGSTTWRQIALPAVADGAFSVHVKAVPAARIAVVLVSGAARSAQRVVAAR